MKFFVILGVFLLPASTCLAQFDTWSPMQQITSGPGNDTQLSLMRCYPTPFMTIPRQQSMSCVFARTSNSGNSDIMLITTRDSGSSWENEPVAITHDSTDNRQPVIAKSGDRRMIAWIRSGKLVYRYSADSVWQSTAEVHAAAGGTDANPDCAPFSNGFGVTWLHDSTVMYSEFIDSAWSTPVLIAQPAGSDRPSPRISMLASVMSSVPYFPVIVWDQQGPTDTNHMIMFSYRDTSWHSPDTIASGSDNRNPGFSLGVGIYWGRVHWETNTNGYCSVISASPVESPAKPITWNPDYDAVTFDDQFSRRDASFLVLPVIINQSLKSARFPYFTAGIWNTTDTIGERIDVSLDMYIRSFRPPQGVKYNNPRLAEAFYAYTYYQFVYYRIWTLWVGNGTGEWRIYGSSNSYIVSGVDDDRSMAATYSLQGNFPNPFNSGTWIRYSLTSREFLTLDIYDLLGKKVARIFDGIQEPGGHQVSWNGKGNVTGVQVELPSGIYFARMNTKKGVKSIRMMLLR